MISHFPPEKWIILTKCCICIEYRFVNECNQNMELPNLAPYRIHIWPGMKPCVTIKRKMEFVCRLCNCICIYRGCYDIETGIPGLLLLQHGCCHWLPDCKNNTDKWKYVEHRMLPSKFRIISHRIEKSIDAEKMRSSKHHKQQHRNKVKYENSNAQREND